jgi:putative transcriptional regulator
LIAMPQLQDPNFVRAVMLIVQHDEDGTFGLVLNRPVDMSAQELCVGLEMHWGGDPELPLHWGGPVQPQTGWMLFADDPGDRLHVARSDEDLPAGDSRLEDAGAAREATDLGNGLHFAGSLEVLRQIVEAPPADLRLFLGYAGWGPGQLEHEMAEGVWLTAPATRDAIFSVDDSEMWDHVVRSLGVEPSSLTLTPGVH